MSNLQRYDVAELWADKELSVTPNPKGKWVLADEAETHEADAVAAARQDERDRSKPCDGCGHGLDMHSGYEWGSGESWCGWCGSDACPSYESVDLIDGTLAPQDEPCEHDFQFTNRTNPPSGRCTKCLAKDTRSAVPQDEPVDWCGWTGEEGHGEPCICPPAPPQEPQEYEPCGICGEPIAYLTERTGWNGGYLHAEETTDGHDAVPQDGKATDSDIRSALRAVEPGDLVEWWLTDWGTCHEPRRTRAFVSREHLWISNKIIIRSMVKRWLVADQSMFETFRIINDTTSAPQNEGDAS